MNKDIISKIIIETGELGFYKKQPEELYNFRDIILEGTKLKNRLIIKFNNKKSAEEFNRFIDILDNDLRYIKMGDKYFLENQVLVINFNWQLIDIRYKREMDKYE